MYKGAFGWISMTYANFKKSEEKSTFAILFDVERPIKIFQNFKKDYYLY